MTLGRIKRFLLGEPLSNEMAESALRIPKWKALALMSSDALPWSVLAYIQLTEAATTSSSRIFVKILFQELSEILGLVTGNAAWPRAVFVNGKFDAALSSLGALDGAKVTTLSAAIRETPVQLVDEGAEVSVLPGPYDDAVAEAARSDSRGCRAASRMAAWVAALSSSRPRDGAGADGAGAAHRSTALPPT